MKYLLGKVCKTLERLEKKPTDVQFPIKPQNFYSHLLSTNFQTYLVVLSENVNMKLIIFAGIYLALVCVPSSLGKPSAKNLLWFPKEDGSGVVPAILGDTFDPDYVPSEKANPNNINFWLWSHHNTDKRTEIHNTTASMDASNWDVNAPVKIFAHGFTGNSFSGPTMDVKRAYINEGFRRDVNLILVDWSWLAAAPWYDVAAAGTQVVGNKLAHLLDFLVKNGYTTVDKIHMTGHSLGAHVAGYTGRFFREIHGVNLPRVTGFDPALPRFGDAPDSKRLDKTDADFVDVIHTNAGPLITGDLGMREPCGHFDVYPNKGSSQPGCGGSFELIAMCSHLRVVTLWAESVNSDRFRACQCDDDNYKGKDQFTTCSCDRNEVEMGDGTPAGTSGIYYLATNSKSPFALG